MSGSGRPRTKACLPGSERRPRALRTSMSGSWVKHVPGSFVIRRAWAVFDADLVEAWALADRDVALPGGAVTVTVRAGVGSLEQDAKPTTHTITGGRLRRPAARTEPPYVGHRGSSDEQRCRLKRA